jgi:hypothetical protein
MEHITNLVNEFDEAVEGDQDKPDKDATLNIHHWHSKDGGRGIFGDGPYHIVKAPDAQ